MAHNHSKTRTFDQLKSHQRKPKASSIQLCPSTKGTKEKWKPCKLGKRTSGPYRVLQTHVNGTLTIELRPGISERLNIRRVILYKEPTAT